MAGWRRNVPSGWSAGTSGSGGGGFTSGEPVARELAARMTRILRGFETTSLIDKFATDTHAAWQRQFDAGHGVEALPGTDPWVRDNAARIVSCIPASGDDLQQLLAQIGLSNGT